MYTLKKSLGQHFLKDDGIARKIVEAVVACGPERLVEVGPGGGALTQHLLGVPDVDFKAVEVDDEKVAYLLKTFPQLSGRLIHQSFLDIPKPFDAPFSVVGNFPYNISTQIVFRLLEWKEDIRCMVGMFQKEVAERIAASEGSKVYGVTSVLTQAYFDVTYLFEVGENSFNPPPKVRSAVIRMVPRQEAVALASDKRLFLLVKTAFQQRRKTLRNACRGLFRPEVLTQEIFNRRAEQLSVTEFAQLTFEMQ